MSGACGSPWIIRTSVIAIASSTSAYAIFVPVFVDMGGQRTLLRVAAPAMVPGRLKPHNVTEEEDCASPTGRTTAELLARSRAAYQRAEHALRRAAHARARVLQLLVLLETGQRDSQCPRPRRRWRAGVLRSSAPKRPRRRWRQGVLSRMVRAPSRALTIRAPWVNFILDGAKTWEICGRPAAYRGRLMLAQTGTGVISGEVTFVECRQLQWSEFFRYVRYHRVESYAPVAGYTRLYAWVFADAVRYWRPVPYRHPYGAVGFVKQGLPEWIQRA